MIDRRHNPLLRLGSNIGADVTVALNIIDGSRKPVGNAQVRMSADFDLDHQLGGGEQDPLSLNNLEQIMPGDKGNSVLQVTTGSRPHSRPGNGTLMGQITRYHRSSQQCINSIVILLKRILIPAGMHCGM